MHSVRQQGLSHTMPDRCVPGTMSGLDVMYSLVAVVVYRNQDEAHSNDNGDNSNQDLSDMEPIKSLIGDT